SSTLSSSSSSSSATSASTSSQGLPSFWIPSLTPEAKPTLLKKPSKAVLCPMSGRPIKMNELITVRFTPLDPSLDRVALLTRQVLTPLTCHLFSSQGGTGFAASGVDLRAKEARPVMQV
ncbi:nitric oxide synthase-interacting protein-like, partial [Seriola lalandi dorsalis]|uniref:nitric oxide synthase-interacting protein-like n=1 Tax=Seriola lalandi dorsalis TaxID=1841481 RepID=UPI000C6F4529